MVHNTIQRSLTHFQIIELQKKSNFALPFKSNNSLASSVESRKGAITTEDMRLRTGRSLQSLLSFTKQISVSALHWLWLSDPFGSQQDIVECG